VPRPPDEGRLRARHPEGWRSAPFQSPAFYAASLGNVLCFGGLPHREHTSGQTLIAEDRFIGPDSYFVRDRVRSLPSDLLTSLGADEPQRLEMTVESSGVETQPGLYYFAGAAWDQFGHFVLEGLARWWLLARLPESVRAELRFVVYNERPLRPGNSKCWKDSAWHPNASCTCANPCASSA
jgi:hypothetical protein